MALDPTTPRSRRALLTAAVAATAVTVVEAVARPLPVSAADGDDTLTIHVGDTYADAQSQTTLANKANDKIVLYVASNADSGHGGGTAVYGFSHHGKGVKGQSTIGIGVYGISTNGSGVRGESTDHSGVFGGSNDGNGVEGVSTQGAGLAGSSINHHGVSGDSYLSAGVYGYSGPGTGVHAESSAGTALRVEGRAHFSRSGTATVTAGHKSVTVTVSGALPGTPLCFANLRSYRSGISVAAVRSNYPSAGKMRIYLTKTVSSATSVAWMVMD